MNEDKALALFKCLADKSRLQILKSLAQQDMYVELLAERLNLSAPTVSFHLKKLQDAGCVSGTKSQYYTVYSLNRAVFSVQLMDVLMEKSDDADRQLEREAQYRQKVLDTFFEYGKLKSIPAQRKKRRIVLEKIVECFTYDRTYDEREVNLIIADFHDDFCTLRREMIMEGLMERDHQTYWRVAPF